jgi:hemerythrin-like domain-containing protein
MTVPSLRGREGSRQDVPHLDTANETAMPDTLSKWHTEHVNFAKLLNLLDAELDLFHKGESPNYELMLDIMFYMTHYPDVLHHPREDLAFAKIKTRDKSAGATVDELSEQHAQLRRIGEELVSGLSDIVNGSIASRESVETPGRAYVENFRSHMRTEEKEILPVAAKLLRDEDWAEIVAAIAHIDDPLFGAAAEKRYAAIHRQIARQAQAAKAASR